MGRELQSRRVLSTSPETPSITEPLDGYSCSFSFLRQADLSGNFTQMPLTRRVAVRLACSACELRTGRSVPPTVNQRVPSVRAARSRATFLPSTALPSIDVPPPHRLLPHFHRSANPPIPLQPKQKQIIENIYIYIFLMWRPQTVGG